MLGEIEISTESFLNILSTYKDLAFFISIGLSIIIAILGVVPSVFVTGANIMFFGPFNGFLISLLGETIGAFITFYLYRFGFKKKADSLEGKYKFIDKIIKSKGKNAFILVFETRLIPFIPSGFVTLAASVSSMNVLGFTIATFLGKIPSIALEAVVSYDILNIEENFIRLLFTLIGILLVFFTLKGKRF